MPDDGSRYYAPWREDPRPLTGLLHGTYAFLGVAGFWRRQRTAASGEAERQAHAEYARWQEAVRQAADTLADSGRLTEAGQIFVAGMISTLRSWRDDQIPADASALAKAAADAHRARWTSENAAADLPG